MNGVLTLIGITNTTYIDTIMIHKNAKRQEGLFSFVANSFARFFIACKASH